ncbi:MAG: VanZ family protein [Hungatella sp.]
MAGKHRKHPCAAYVMLFMLIGVIGWFSGQQGKNSHGMSMWVSEKVVEVVDCEAKLELHDKQFRRLVHYLDKPIRKSAHLIEYALAGGILYAIVSCYVGRGWKRIGMVIVLLAVLGGIDELHQLFVLGRDGKWQDVAVDVCGGMIGMGIGGFFVIGRKG